ncbi:MAG: Fe-S protein assembly co-chaperone HscB [Alphaproteobacteria bacterium]|jgi:molecular chaperone HscB|nr:Fe-S protein assembly co-chaperone HscB [Alphaproteobacteria bacterium]MBT5390469.1 Fe-S protein assembly co-chaperone HscB [Alphaproteobacteria bacterium]MBT5540421.1 Fe-S protein assembly co-chaperone HscB [Alphaproteobacteria bacterium]MBT5654695.1 Fe-S protein assembly co-chaperone HscB [Alphaproteobacteria bacterium]
MSHSANFLQSNLDCWFCQAPIEASHLTCPECASLQEPAAMDHFQRLFLSVQYELEMAQLERAYFEEQAKVHPDQFVGKTDREKNCAVAHSSCVNEAYAILKDPLKRAQHFLAIKGIDTTEAGDSLRDVELLEEMMIWNEKVHESASREGIDHELRLKIEKGFSTLSRTLSGSDLPQAVKIIYRLKYYTKLLDDFSLRKH